jgi:hypothetical protein
VAALSSSLVPLDPEGHDLWLRGRKGFVEGRFIRRHYVAEHATCEHGRDGAGRESRAEKIE